MSKFRRWLKSVQNLVITIGQMIVLAWQAQPSCFIALIAIQCLQGLVPLATAWLTKVLFDVLAQSLQGHAPPTLIKTLLFLLSAQILVTVISKLIVPVNQYLNADLVRKLTLTIRSNMYRKLNSFVGLAYFENPSFHDTIQVASNNAQIAPLQSLNMFSILIQGVVTLLSFIGVLITLSPLLAGIVGIAVLPQIYAQFKFSRQHFDVAFDNSPKERQASYYGQVLSWVAFAKEVCLFNLGNYFLNAFVHTTQEIHRAQQGQQKREIRWQLVLSVLASAVSSGAFVVVVMQALSGSLSLGDIALYTSAVASVQSTLTNMVFTLSQMNEIVLFFRQYTNLLALQQPLHVYSLPRAVPPLTSGITLNNVSFRYSDAHPWVLRHIDLFLPANQCLALVGLNGAGKTTLVKLLTRLYDPTEGQILWDGIDIREFDPEQFRQRIGAIFQDFSRYDLTVQDNIGLGNVTQIDNCVAVQKAAVKAGIHERIEALPQSYQSTLSRWLARKEAAGVDLSGGEWQKIALARMFMRNADMLMLDEPTAALDAQAEYELYRHFRDLMHGRTCVLITHRFSTVRMADSIAVLENGYITEYGMHDALLCSGGTYAKLYSMQAESYR